MDKRVKTALRRLLNERLFGNTDKKKSRRDDDNADTLTNADSVGNNVSDASSVVGTRSRLRHSVAPVTQGKVGPLEEDSKGGKDPRKVSVRVVVENPQGAENDDLADVENEENGGGQERPLTRVGPMLPPLRTPRMPLDRVYTPANYPKWGLCVTASQRTMLVDGLERDKTFLSRSQAQSAWGSRGDDDVTLPPSSRGNGGQDDLDIEDDAYLDPHRPDSADLHSNGGGGGHWAHKLKPGGGTGAQSLAVTKSSGRIPLNYDDRRLKRLLEELYKDKKYMDKLINNIKEDHLDFPEHIAADDVKFLSEFGRSYLLKRAEYWDLHGPLGPPRAPPTALGMKLSRAQTSLTTDALHHDDTKEVTSPRPKTVR
ncbi:hypothetical protein V1264_004429 [Littorina saxatilis]|uniref:Uncharacterized protein n=1 Tax=Littorina saxatilis TaxID=31220 RepID=A0AAN9B253_9CAEN